MVASLLFCFTLWAALAYIPAVQDVVAQSTPTLSEDVTPTATNKAAQTHTVAVGNRCADQGNNQYVPDVIVAKVGDIIEFDFFPPNHSVARAEAGSPCYPYEYTGHGKVGFFSGFHFLPNIPVEPSTYKLLINDTDPVFFYCSAPGSCLNYAMVGVINPNASFSIAQQKDIAKNSGYMTVPGESPPQNEDGSSVSTLTPSAGTPTPSADHQKLSSGAIAGIAVAGVVAAGLIGAIIFILGRNSKIISRRRKDPPANSSLQPPYDESNLTHMYSSKPMSEYDPYAALSPYGAPSPQGPPVELSSPEPDMNRRSSMLSGVTAYDDARWQTMTPPLRQQPTVRSELDASPPLHGSAFPDHLEVRERPR